MRTIKVLSVIVSITVLARCSAIPFSGKFDLSGITFRQPDPEVGTLLSLYDPTNTTKKPWEFGSCYTQPAISGRNAITYQSSKWTNKILYYTLSTTFTAAQRNIINASMTNIQANSCIKFVKRTSQADYVQITGAKTGCWSYIGRIGGKQTLNLQRNGCLYDIGTGVHELLHALGIFHEHERTDRDTYITVNYTNVDPKYTDQFNKVSTTEATTFGLAYDYTSVMHYDKYAFSKNGLPTMIATQTTAPENYGQRNGMTELDIAKLKALYDCP